MPFGLWDEVEQLRLLTSHTKGWTEYPIGKNKTPGREARVFSNFRKLNETELYGWRSGYFIAMTVENCLQFLFINSSQ